jgi:hypothetical protein
VGRQLPLRARTVTTVTSRPGREKGILLVKSRFVWPAVVVVAVLVGAALPLLVNRGYYFIDDTQSGAFGQWYEIGTRILEGNWSLINPLVWQSGNYLAEGAWGIFSPVLWVVGLWSHWAGNALIFSTIVKIVCLVSGSLGAYLLARTFSSTRPWAAAVAVALPFAGVTFYLDATTWVNGLLAWSMWALAWALTRRAVFSAKSPTLALLACIGTVGIGYVHATIFLAVALAATIAEAFIARHRASIVRAFLLATGAGLFAVIVHLPGLLTAGSSGRTKGIENTGLLTVDLSGLVAGNTPVGIPQVGFFGAFFPSAPLVYMSWMLPLFAFIAWKKLMPVLATRLSIVILLGVALVGVLLPSDVGPLRIPLRMMPYLTIALLMILAIGMSLARVEVLTRKRFLAGSAYAAFGGLLTVFQGPQYAGVVALATAAVILVLWVFYRITAPSGLPVLPPPMRDRARSARGWLLPGLAIIVTLGVIYPQHLVHTSGPLLNYQVPSSVDSYRNLLSDAEGDVLVVGGPFNGAIRTEDWAETTVANLWYIPDAPVQNAYTSVFYPGYGDALCMAYQGVTCAELLPKLFTSDSDTGQNLVDDLGVSSILIVKSSVPEELWATTPEGWHVADDSSLTRLIVRDTPVAGAGSVVWAEEGTSVTVVHEDDMGVSFRVDEVGDDGGQVALSRISWPGYVVDGGTVSDELVNGFMMGVDIPASAEGEVVTVSFRAPGWQLQVTAGALLIVLILGWGLLRQLGRPRRSAAAGSPAWAAELREPLKGTKP